MAAATTNDRWRALVATHLAVLLFGVAGLFGKFLALPAAMIVLGRTFFAAGALALILAMRRGASPWVPVRELPRFALLGALLAVHWVTFFHSIQISTVAIGLLTYSSFPIFVIFFEPVFLGGRIRRAELIDSLVVVVGLVLVIPEFDLSNRLTEGALWGLVSGATFALLTVLNRKYVARHEPLTIACYQNAFASVCLVPFVGAAAIRLSPNDLAVLVLLGLVFTALAHTLFIHGLREIRAQLASVIACLEPVYGIALALLLLGEVPSLREILGGTIIIGAIVYATRRSGVRVAP